MLDRDEMLATTRVSPAFVARHDKRGWLDLFATGGVVEDPVGSAPHCKGRLRRQGGEDALERFYETFIAPNEIRFEVHRDLVAGNTVVRDVDIHTRLSTGLEISVPAHLVYELTSEEGRVRIRRLAAHWELVKLSRQALSSGFAGLRTMTRLGWRMFSIQGLGGVTGYLRGMRRGIFRRGPETARVFANALEGRDAAGLEMLFADPLAACIEFPVGKPLPPAALLAKLDTTAPVRLEKVVPAGFTTAFRFELGRGVAARRGTGFFDFDPASKKITTARFFTADASGRGPRG